MPVIIGRSTISQLAAAFFFKLKKAHYATANANEPYDNDVKLSMKLE